MNETFGQLLKRKRRGAGVSQRDLANKIGVDFSYISKMENDRMPPPAADTIVKISHILDCEADEMLALTGKIPTEIQQSIASQISAQQFLREAVELGLSNEDWQNLTSSLKQFRVDNTSDE